MNVRAEYGKRARQKATHHEAILEAAERIFGLRHPAEVAVDEIAAEAGVAKGTVYNYFADKVSLIEAISRRVQIDVADRVASAMGTQSSSPARIAMGLSAFLQLAVDDPWRAMTLSRLNLDAPDLRSPLSQVFIAELKRGTESGALIAPSLDAALTLVLAIAHGASLRIIETREPGAARDHGAALIAFGLCALGVGAVASDLHVRSAFGRLGLA